MKTFIISGNVKDIAAILTRIATENPGKTVVEYMEELNKEELILKAW